MCREATLANNVLRLVVLITSIGVGRLFYIPYLLALRRWWDNLYANDITTADMGNTVCYQVPTKDNEARYIPVSLGRTWYIQLVDEVWFKVHIKTLLSEAGISGRDKEFTVGCYYLSLPEIPAFGNKVHIFGLFGDVLNSCQSPCRAFCGRIPMGNWVHMWDTIH